MAYSVSLSRKVLVVTTKAQVQWNRYPMPATWIAIAHYSDAQSVLNPRIEIQPYFSIVHAVSQRYRRLAVTVALVDPDQVC